MSDYYVKNLVTALPLAVADAFADHALRIGNEHDMLPLTVAVLDAGGHLVAFKREDGSGIMRGDVAIGNGEDLLPFLNQHGDHSTPVIVFSSIEASKEKTRDIEAVLLKSKTSNEDLLETIRSACTS